MKKRRFKLSSFQIILYGFALIILVGSVLLAMPFSSRSGQWTDPITVLFTTTSSVCVTGLSVCDTGTYWSLAGQIIILLLIQIGGMGVVLVAASIVTLTGRRIGLLQRYTLQNAVSAPQVGGIIRFILFIVRFVFAAELTGTVLLSIAFVPEYGPVKGLWYSFFHSVSAFCNAGFDIFGATAEGSSLMRYSGSWLVLGTIMALIIAGGLGFLTWQNLFLHKKHAEKLRVQTKLILIATVFLIFIPALFLFVECKDLPLNERILGSLFQSVTTRTAGFNSMALSSIPEPGQGVMTLLMLIGGAPGSTAGGFKITTIAVLLLCGRSIIRREDEVNCLKHRIDTETIRYACTVFILYLTMFFLSGVAISALEDLPLHTCLFETASATGTVGLTLGITSSLGVVSKLILIVLMFFGRVGGMTLVYAIIPGITYDRTHYTAAKIMIG